MNLKQNIQTLGIIGLLVFGIMSFIIISQSDNDVSEGIINDYRINQTYGDLDTSLSESEDDAVVSYGNFSKTPPTQEFGELQVTSILSAINTGKSLTTGLWTVLIKLPLTILNVSPVIINILGAIFLITLLIAIWLVMKGVSQ